MSEPEQMDLGVTVQLTAKEIALFDLLLDVARHHERSTVNGNGKCTVLRVAGGWVRDKLLGRESDDIDIALDDCTGAVFAERVNRYLVTQRGAEAVKVGIIAANPDQSKHLETATMRLLEMDIDLVNLRTETYTDAGGRIPNIQVGTAEQDASRRDFTINAMFYNLNTRCVEDLTGRGVTDLHRGVLRTPLDPSITFIDDPLRVMRAVRFAARYSFTLDEALTNAARQPDVRSALSRKVSRERIGKELHGALDNGWAAGARALRHIFSLGLGAIVFELPSTTPLVVVTADANGDACAQASASGVVSAGANAGASARTTPATKMAASASTGTCATPPLPGPLAGASVTTDAALSHSVSTHGASPLTLSTEAAVSQHFGSTCWGLPLSDAAAAEVHCGPTSTFAQLDGVWQLVCARAPRGTGSQGGVSAVSVGIGSDYMEHHRHVLLLAAALQPLHGATYRERPTSLKMAGVPSFVVRTSLKLRVKEANDVQHLLDGAADWPTVIAALERAVPQGDAKGVGAVACPPLGTEAYAQGRLRAGLVVRSLRELWPGSLMLACASDLAERAARPGHALTAEETSAVLTKYESVYEAVIAMGLEGVWRMPPLLDGKMLMQALPHVRGPLMGRAMQLLLHFQLMHPEASAEEGVKYLRPHLE